MYIQSILYNLSLNRRGAQPITYPIPSGPLLKLLLIHIKGGHELLTQDDRGNSSDRMVRLFVSRSGREFTNSSFTQYWETFMRSTETNGQGYFPPSVARTMFIEQVWDA